MKFVFVVGPTASGKSHFAYEACRQIGSEIINCDSVQVYEGLNIGAAKPSEGELATVPHHLLSYVKAPDIKTAGQYFRDFYALTKTLNEGKTYFVVGGTGFYFQAIEKGLYDVEITDPDLKKQIFDEMHAPDGPQKLYEELKQKDPQTAVKIHPNDHYRIGRALELIRAENRTLTEIKTDFAGQTFQFPFPLKKIGVTCDREILRERIIRRIEKMLQEGLVDEVQALVAKGLSDWKPLQSVGYKETLEYLKENHSRDWLIENITTSTMQLAKKQMTWFKRDQQIQWLESNSSHEDFLDKI